MSEDKKAFVVILERKMRECSGKGLTPAEAFWKIMWDIAVELDNRFKEPAK